MIQFQIDSTTKGREMNNEARKRAYDFSLRNSVQSSEVVSKLKARLVSRLTVDFRNGTFNVKEIRPNIPGQKIR